MANDGGPGIRSATADEIEQWCDRFAVELLMPSKWITNFAGEFERIARPEVLFGGPMLFDVSREAFYLRLANLYRVVILEISSSGKVASWSRKTPRITKETAIELLKNFSQEELEGTNAIAACKGPFRFRFSEGENWVVLIAS
jgi:Zn-dependent peptidase ImmA (M78 family)